MNTVTFPPLAISLVALVLIFARGRCLVATGQKIRAAEDAISGFGGTQNPCRGTDFSSFLVVKPRKIRAAARILCAAKT